MKETNNIIQFGQVTAIMNGGNPLKDCPTDWDDAKKWEDKANDGKGDNPQWKFDCGFKLDYDGSLVSISSRFYPPKTHYGATWDGTVTVSVLEKDLIEKKFDCETLEELKKQVEKYIEELSSKTSQFLKELK